MTQEEIIEMSVKAGIDIGMWEKLSDNDDVFGYDIGGTHENLEAFAKLVAEKERSECAKICDNATYLGIAALFCANEIRARGNV